MPSEDFTNCCKQLEGSANCIKSRPKTGESYVMKGDFEIKSEYGNLHIFIPAGTICHIVDNSIPGHIAFKTKGGFFMAEVTPEAFEKIFYINGGTD